MAAAWAGVTHGQSLTVQATLEASCSAQSTTLDFGQYVSGQTGDVATSTPITINCTSGMPVTIKLDAGQNDNGTDRGMSAGGADVLKYNLYLEGDYLQVWGDGATFGNSAKNITSFDPLNPTLPVYGRISAGQSVAPGSYSDQVTITVELGPTS